MECPFCLSEIPDEAVTCRACTKSLGGPEADWWRFIRALIRAGEADRWASWQRLTFEQRQTALLNLAQHPVYPELLRYEQILREQAAKSRKRYVLTCLCLVLGLAAAAAGLLVMMAYTGTERPSRTAARHAEASEDQLMEALRKYGPADEDESSEYEVPRPPLVTRRLTYRQARVRIVFLAKGPIGSPPPYAGWTLMSFQDPKTNAVIEPVVANARLVNARIRQSRRSP